MPLVNMTDMLQHAYHLGCAVGAFGVASWGVSEMAGSDQGLDLDNELIELNTGRAQSSLVHRIG